MPNHLSPTLQILLARFNGQILIPFSVGSASIGIAEQTARNQLSSGKYPLPTVMVGSRRFIHIEDLASFVETRRTQSVKPKRGRPTKASKMTAAQGRV